MLLMSPLSMTTWQQEALDLGWGWGLPDGALAD